MFAEKAGGIFILDSAEQTNLMIMAFLMGIIRRGEKKGKKEHNENSLEMRHSTWDHYQNTVVQFCLRFMMD